MTLQQALSIFDAMCSRHISQKMDYIRGIFEANNLATRQCQIKANFKSFVYELTQRDIEELSQFKLPN